MMTEWLAGFWHCLIMTISWWIFLIGILEKLPDCAVVQPYNYSYCTSMVGSNSVSELEPSPTMLPTGV
jgi:hypothetical protein